MKATLLILLVIGLALGVDVQLQSTVDIIFQIDESPSMLSEQNIMKEKASVLVEQLEMATNGNFRVGLIGYGRQNIISEYTMKISELTNDAATLSSAVDALTTSGSGSNECGLHAMKLTAEDNVRGGSLGISGPFCAVVISDGFSCDDPINVNDVIDSVVNNDGYQFVIGTDDVLNQYSQVVNGTRGSTFSLSSFISNPESIISSLVDACVDIISQIVILPNKGTCNFECHK